MASHEVVLVMHLPKCNNLCCQLKCQQQLRGVGKDLASNNQPKCFNC